MGLCFILQSSLFRRQDTKTLFQYFRRSQLRWFRHPHSSGLSCTGSSGTSPKRIWRKLYVVREGKKDTLLAVLPPQSWPYVSRKLMDVYFEAQQGFGSELHIRPFYNYLWGWGCSLRSSGRALWVVLRTVLITKGDLVFAVKAPQVCNTLPELTLARSVATF